jgi:two-component system sensor histidine kinase HydH
VRALRALPIGIVVSDSQAHVRLANASALDLLGLGEPDVGGRPLAEVVRCTDAAQFARLLRVGDGSLETTLLRPDGTGVAVGLQLRRLGSEQAAGESVLLLSDLGEIRRMEDQLRRKDRLAYIGQFSTEMAHEVRNPLAGITTSAEVLRSRLGADDQQRQFLDVILDQAARLTRIVDTFLRFVRPTTAPLVLCDIEQCVRTVTGLLSAEMETHGVHLKLQLSSTPLPPLYMNRDQIVQVLLNVVNNALQAMPNGGTLTIRTRLARQSGSERRHGGRRATDRPHTADGRTIGTPVVEIQVADTGFGVAPALLPRLFDPFVTSRTGGTGLGLPISLAIVQEHGGQMWITSPAGEGTTVTIQLPVDKRRGQRRATAKDTA